MSKIIPTTIPISVDNLLLDNKNPRLPESINANEQLDIWNFMRQAYDLEELALSIATNGYFEAEPMVAIPLDKNINLKQEYEEYINNKDSKYIVVEGNRRLSTIQGLLKNTFKDITLEKPLEEQFNKLPVVVYPNRDEVLAFLGVHHLAGVRKWNVYERARFIVGLKRDKNIALDEIQKTIGDRKNSARKTYGCYRLIEIVKEYNGSFDTRNAKNNFSYLQLATGQEPIREYIGLSTWNNIEDIDNLIHKDKKENLCRLFTWMFGDGQRKSIITDSRQITNRLAKILNDDEGIQILEENGSLDNAFEFIGGELEGMANLSSNAQKKLETINGKLSSIDISQIITIEKGKQLKNKILAINNVVTDILRKFHD